MPAGPVIALITLDTNLASSVSTVPVGGGALASSNTASPKSFSNCSLVFKRNPSSVKPSSVSNSIGLIKYPLYLSTKASPSSLSVPC